VKATELERFQDFQNGIQNAAPSLRIKKEKLADMEHGSS
jgi:hypothetical protein